MQRPTWVLAVGILGIVFGIFGIIGSGQSILMPVFMKFQKQMMPQIEEQIQKEAGEDNKIPAKQMEIVKKMWDMPDWFQTWSVVVGLVGMLVSGFYILASIFLLLMKRNGPKLFYIAAGTSIALSATKIIVALSAALIIGLSFAVWGAVGIICTGVLLIVTATADKSAFQLSSYGAHRAPINL